MNPAIASALIGRRLGVYEIRTLIGSGGMGHVYRARDTRLGRDVAIKVLPPALTSDPERLARFEREAQVLAALNHSHIGAIYGIEESDAPEGSGEKSVRALVLELVEGDTLADRIASGPIAAGQAIAIAEQIADALDAAHAKGIIHRDLKPANIKVTADDVVKVLDFGIAKMSFAVSSNGTDATTTTGDTRDGLIVGTVPYMSPEQARGHPVDKRTDVWAFGCLLYEMLAGRRAFSGKTVSDTIAAILDRDPDWSHLPATTPPAVSHVIRRCLTKNPKQRLRDIGDARAELQESSNGQTSSPPARPTRTQITRWIAGVALAVVAFGLLYYVANRRPPAIVGVTPTQVINVILNWPEELRRRTSGDGR